MIPVQNIYYMLAYAFQVLNENGYKDIETEQFDNVGELCAAILAKGVALQLKRGLGKEYIPQTELLSYYRFHLKFYLLPVGLASFSLISIYKSSII